MARFKNEFGKPKIQKTLSCNLKAIFGSAKIWKLTHQFGRSDAYNCEFEVFDDSQKPEELMKKYNVPIHLPTQTEDFWRKWNERVNLNAEQLSDEELLGIIRRYLN